MKILLNTCFIYILNSMRGSAEIRDIIVSFLKTTNKPVSISALARKTGISRNTLSKYLDGMVVNGSVSIIHHGMAKKFYIHSKESPGHTENNIQELILIIDTSRSLLIFDKTCQKNSISRLTSEQTEELQFPQEISAVLESGQFLQWLSGIKTAEGSLHSLYEIKKTDDASSAVILYRAFPIPLEGIEPLVVVYTTRSHKTTPRGARNCTYPPFDESTTETDDCIIILQDMYIVHASPSFSRILGRPLDSIKGCNIKRFFQASSGLALENCISSISKGICTTTPPLDITLVSPETGIAGNYSFHFGWIPYMDSRAVIGVLRKTTSQRMETTLLQQVSSEWDNYLKELLTRLQIYERESCAVLIPWALEYLHSLLNSDECILDIYIRDMDNFRCSYCWRASQTSHGTDTGLKSLDVSSSSLLPFEKLDSVTQRFISKNYEGLLRIPIRKNKETLGWFSWHPKSYGDASVLDREKLEMICTLLALKVWHQQCIERAQASQQGFNEVFGKVTI
jgi:predicted transcriptional regulator